VEEFGGSLSVEAITKFVDDGGVKKQIVLPINIYKLCVFLFIGNILIAGSSNSGDIVREITAECGFEVDEEGAAVIDHLNYDAQDQGKHTLIVADPANLIDAPMIVGSAKHSPFLYRGTGLIADKENPLVLEILTASSTAYSYKPDAPIEEVPLFIFRHNEKPFYLPLAYILVSSCGRQEHGSHCSTSGA